MKIKQFSPAQNLSDAVVSNEHVYFIGSIDQFYSGDQRSVMTISKDEQNRHILRISDTYTHSYFNIMEPPQLIFKV